MKPIDRCYCEECGAEIDLTSGLEHEAGRSSLRCCRYCGAELMGATTTTSLPRPSVAATHSGHHDDDRP